MFGPLKRGAKDRVPSATGLLSFWQLGSIGFHPSLDPATKLLCIWSIWTTFGQILSPKGFEALNPLRINEPIKSSSGYVYQFHLSTLLHYIIATQLPDTPHRCQNRQCTGARLALGRNNERDGKCRSQSRVNVRITVVPLVIGRLNEILLGRCQEAASGTAQESGS